MSVLARTLNYFENKPAWALPLIIICAAIALLAAMQVLAPAPGKKIGPDKAMLVNVLTARKQDYTLQIPSQGRVTPRINTILTSEVSGAVIEVSEHFVTGGFVRKGQLLLKLDDRNYRAALKRAEADVARFNNLLIQEKGRAQVAYNQWKKSKDVKRTPEALSLLLRKPQLREAEANLEFAQAELERVRGDLAKTEIRAPFDGLIKKKFIDYAQNAITGTNIAELVSVDYAEVRLAIPQDRLAYLNLPDVTDAFRRSLETSTNPSPENPEEPVSEPEETTGPSPEEEWLPSVPVTLSSDYGEYIYEWPARITRTESLFDEKNYSLYAVAQIKDPYGLEPGDSEAESNLKPLLMGTYVEALIQGQTIRDVIILPRHVLRAGNHIWVIDENNQLRNRELEILNIGGDAIYVTSGLEDGERVCLTHVGEVVPGTPVRIAGNQSDQTGNQ